MIKLIIADDHKIVRCGLQAILEEREGEFKVIGEASSGKELIEMLADSQAELILMDMNMPEMDGLEATKYINEHFPHIKVLMLSIIDQEKYVADAIEAGALGYILKTTDSEELMHAIRIVARGKQYISTQISMNILRNLDATQAATASVEPAEETCKLSKRELEVLQLIAQGYTNNEIADITFTSKRTVESHRQSLLEKTGSKNTASLIMYAARHRLLDETKPTDSGS